MQDYLGLLSCDFTQPKVVFFYFLYHQFCKRLSRERWRQTCLATVLLSHTSVSKNYVKILPNTYSILL